MSPRTLRASHSRTQRPAAAKPIAARIVQPGDRSTAPLRLFHLSDHNVRNTYDPAEIVELAANIRELGLLDQLHVEPSPEGGGKLAVVDGGRRLRALWWLEEDGAVDGDHEVAYRLADPADAREISLAANVHKVALNPVDEIEAYAAIVADHPDKPDPLAYCAQRQGVSRRHVARMLRLADLHPEILEALGAGALDLDAAQAYASTGDREQQALVFAQQLRQTYGRKHDPRTIRDTLRARTYPAAIAQALYVGLDAYRAAGGRSEADLFMGEAEGERLLDPALLDRLARAKAETDLPAAVAADGLASGALTLGFNAAPTWPKPPATHVARPNVALADLGPAVCAAAIGVYSIAADGAGLVRIGLMMPLALPVDPADAPPPGRTMFERMSDVARAAAAAPQPRDPPPIARRQGEPAADAFRRVRDQEVQRFAAILAAHHLAAEALSAVRLAPVDFDTFEERHDVVELADDGDYLVTVRLRVAPEAVEAMRAEAEAAAGAELDA